MTSLPDRLAEALNDRYRVHVRWDVLDEHDGPMLRHGLQEMEGQPPSIIARELASFVGERHRHYP
jgi:hypothetical protein